jgi:hypothetical protein
MAKFVIADYVRPGGSRDPVVRAVTWLEPGRPSSCGLVEGRGKESPAKRSDRLGGPPSFLFSDVAEHFWYIRYSDCWPQLRTVQRTAFSYARHL